MADSISKIKKPITHSISEYGDVMVILTYVAAEAEDVYRMKFGHGVRTWPKAGGYVIYHRVRGFFSFFLLFELDAQISHDVSSSWESILGIIQT
jgi:hypothetical protein